MATNIGELVWKITGDTRDVDKSLRQTESRVDKFGKAVLAAFSTAALIAFTKKAFDVSRALVTAASDAEETANKFNVVFAGLEEAADAAENLADNYGLSNEASQNLLSSTADLLQGFGVAKDESLDLSTQVQQLAVDLASFSNFAGGAEGASQALTSALLGEREAVKALGIAITETELKRFAEEQGLVFEELTKAEKAFVTFDLAVQQSGNAIGDFARSSESLANQTRVAQANIADLQAVLGKELLPTTRSIVTEFNNVVSALVDIREEQVNLRDALAGEGSADILGALESQRAKVNEIRNAIAAGGDELQILAIKYRISVRRAEEFLEAEQANLRILEQQSAALLRRTQQQDEQTRLAQEALERAEREAELAQNELDSQGKLLELAKLRAQEEAQLVADKQERIEELEQLELESERTKAAARKEALREQQEAEEALTQKVFDETQKRLAFQSQLAGSIESIFGNLIQIQIAQQEELTEAQKRNILTLYRFQQAAAISGIAIDTARAIIGFLADPGGLLGVGLSIAAGLAGATQAAVVAATPPPALQDGGIVPAQPGGRVVQVAEGGQDEAIIPLDRGGIVGPFTFTFVIDGDVIARSTVDKINAGNYTIDLQRGTN